MFCYIRSSSELIWNFLCQVINSIHFLIDKTCRWNKNMQLNRVSFSIETVHSVSDLLSITSVTVDRPVCTQSSNDKQFRIRWLLRRTLDTTRWTENIPSSSTAKWIQHILRRQIHESGKCLQKDAEMTNFTEKMIFVLLFSKTLIFFWCHSCHYYTTDLCWEDDLKRH